MFIEALTIVVGICLGLLAVPMVLVILLALIALIFGNREEK